MAIGIKTKKVIERGIKLIKVTKISLMKLDELPVRYTIGECVYFAKHTCDRVVYMEDHNMRPEPDFLQVGRLYTEKVFNRKMVVIRKCGIRLQKINRELAKENKGWEETEMHSI